MTTKMKIENLEWRISSDLVPYPEALAERVIYLLGNQDEALKLIQQAKDECNKYTWESVKEDWFGVYNSLTQNEIKN